MRLERIKSEDEMVAEYEERCTRRIPLGALVLAAYIAINLICAGMVRIGYDRMMEQDPYVGLADGPYSY